MKKILVIFAFLISISAVAAERDEAAVGLDVIHVVSAQPCNYWTTIRDASGRYAYACANHPMSVSIADAYDIQRILNTLYQRVADLEKRIAELEKQPK